MGQLKKIVNPPKIGPVTRKSQFLHESLLSRILISFTKTALGHFWPNSPHFFCIRFVAKFWGRSKNFKILRFGNLLPTRLWKPVAQPRNFFGPKIFLIGSKNTKLEFTYCFYPSLILLSIENCEILWGRGRGNYPPSRLNRIKGKL